ncbi:MAG: DUF5058 family protein [Ruminococcaceae bacterium]|nr:DUF5058 family protein [Oscillospiraceae bacterium]
MTADFKADKIMFMIAAAVIVFVIAQSVFFIVKSWKRAKELGISESTLKSTVSSSALFTVAPAISILATVFVLANALGIVLPWIRLSVIGNLAYETTAAQTTLDYWGIALNKSVSDPQQFATITVAMTIGSIAPLLMIPFLCKPLQKKVGFAMNKGKEDSEDDEDAPKKKTNLGDVISAGAFIGIVAAFVAREINGRTVATTNRLDAAGNSIVNADGTIEKVKNITGSAGVVSILVLICSMLFMTILTIICKKFKLSKLEPFIMPIAMFAAMGMAILFMNFLPESVSGMTWYEIGAEV